jgi:biotin carboxylase
VQSEDPQWLLEAAQRMRVPLVVKPSDSSGSKGISVVRDHQRLAGAIAAAAAVSYAGVVIVEQTLAGRHCSAECLVRNGRPDFVAVSERTIKPPNLVTVSHLVPARLGAAAAARLVGMIGLVCRALEIDRGPVNFDFVVDPRGEVYLVEMGARPGGNGTPQLVSEAFGANLVEASIRVAMGQPFRLRPRRRRAALLYLLHAERDGELAAVHGTDELAGLPELVDCQL